MYLYSVRTQFNEEIKSCKSLTEAKQFIKNIKKSNEENLIFDEKYHIIKQTWNNNKSYVKDDITVYSEK